MAHSWNVRCSLRTKPWQLIWKCFCLWHGAVSQKLWDRLRPRMTLLCLFAGKRRVSKRGRRGDKVCVRSEPRQQGSNHQPPAVYEHVEHEQCCYWRGLYRCEFTTRLQIVSTNQRTADSRQLKHQTQDLALRFKQRWNALRFEWNVTARPHRRRWRAATSWKPLMSVRLFTQTAAHCVCEHPNWQQWFPRHCITWCAAYATCVGRA